MLNSYWEEQDMADPLIKFHEKQIEKMGLPKWINEIECPFCNERISSRTVYNIQLCLNTRNFGEIAIEVFCDDCKKMDTLYFRTKIKNIADFIECLGGQGDVPEESVIEEEMRKQNYNNILEEMYKTKNEDGKNHDVV